MTDDPDKLRAEANALDLEAAQLEAQARFRRATAELRRSLADELEGKSRRKPLPGSALDVAVRNAPGPLRPRDQHGNKESMVTAQGVRVSLRAIAERVGTTHAFLSMARAGRRRIRRSLAEQIAAIVPELPATRKTWPAGWVDED